MDRTTFHALRVADLKRETEDAISIAFDVPDALREGFSFEPGQYLTLRTMLDGQDIRRSYSICSTPDDPTLRVAIKLIDDGVFSGWAHRSVQQGASIDVLPPDGRFTMPTAPATGRVVLGVAAGSGITPILSILKTVLAHEPLSRFALLYGSRSTASILFRSELEALKDKYLGRLAIAHILSREQQDLRILNGRIDAEKIGTLLPSLIPGGIPDVALLCGPGAMIDAASSSLLDAGMPRATILTERFFAGTPQKARSRPKPSTGPSITATIIADGVSTAVPVIGEETILAAALRAGLDLPYSCQAGMCSTCRARVTGGMATMDVNYGLEPWETDAGFILTCQAHPTTEHVTVDYDHV